MSSVGNKSAVSATSDSTDTTNVQRTRVPKYVQRYRLRHWLLRSTRYCCEVGEEDEIICIYCRKRFGSRGVLSRLMKHLASPRGSIGSCLEVPYDIQQIMDKNFKEYQAKQRAIENYEDAFGDDGAYFPYHSPVTRRTLHARKKKKPNSGVDEYFPNGTTHGEQPSVKSSVQSKEAIEKCDLAITKWLIDASIPFNAVNSVFYQPMIDAIVSMGAGYKGPRMHALVKVGCSCEDCS